MFSKLSDNRWFDSNRKILVQIGYLVLVLLAIILTALRLQDLAQPSRADLLAIIMGVKSLIILAYQLSTTYIASWRRWGSLKAYMILDYMEIVFWFAVVILGFMGVSRRCDGTTCTLGVVVALIAILVMCFALWLAIIATLDHRHYRAHGTKRGDRVVPSHYANYPRA